MEVEGRQGEESEWAGVAPELVEEELASTDAEEVERVRSRMASVDDEEATDAGRMEEAMGEIEAEMREGRTPTVEGVDRVETGLGEGDKAEEGDVVVDISESEEEKVQQVSESETQIMNASRLRRRYLMEESEEEIEPPMGVVETQATGASRRKGRNLAEEPKVEKEDDEEVVLSSQPEAPRKELPVEQPAPAAELEMKRMGKQPELPPKKKFKAAASSVRIEECPFRGGCRLQRDEVQGRGGLCCCPRLPGHADHHSLAGMLKFEDAKLEECKKRITAMKQLKLGKKLHVLSLEKLEAQEEFAQYITWIAFEWLLEMQMPKIPQAMALEFFTSFRFKATVMNLSEECVSFRLCNHQWRMNLTEWSVRLGLYSAAQADQGEWLDREIGAPKASSGFDPQEAWATVIHERAPQFNRTQSRGIHIVDPVLRFAQVFLGYNILAKPTPPAPSHFPSCTLCGG